MAYQETFERKEVKYLLSAAQRAAVMKGLLARMEVDQYGRSGIDSLYYDTPERSIIARSMDKPRYKEKLRVRRYAADVDAGTGVVYVELKKKVAGIVYKRRVRMSEDGARAFLAGMPYEEARLRYPLACAGGAQPGAADPKSVQIAREIEAMVGRHPGIGPSMVVSVQRTALRPLDAADAALGLRVTFDDDVFYDDVAARARGDARFARGRIVPAGASLMEVKCLGAYPLWLARLMDGAHARPTSFSKCGEACVICADARKLGGSPRAVPRAWAIMGKQGSRERAGAADTARPACLRAACAMAS